MALSQELFCTKRVHLGLSEVAFIEGCLHIRVMRSSTVILIAWDHAALVQISESFRLVKQIEG